MDAHHLKFTHVERNEREFDEALRRSEALRQAILQKAFTGRLVPQVASDEPASALLERIRQGSGGISPFDPLRAGDPALQRNTYPEPIPRELKVAEPRRRASRK